VRSSTISRLWLTAEGVQPMYFSSGRHITAIL